MPNRTPFQRGLDSLKAGKGDDAIKHLEQATVESPEDFRAFSYLGAAYAQKKLYDRAVGAFLAALHLRPGVPSIHYNLGLAYQADGFAEKARTEFQNALDIDSTYRKAQDALIALDSRDQAGELHKQACGRHVDEPAVAVCSFCQLPICEKCKTIVEGTVYCPVCARRRVEATIT